MQKTTEHRKICEKALDLEEVGTHTPLLLIQAYTNIHRTNPTRKSEKSKKKTLSYNTFEKRVLCLLWPGGGGSGAVTKFHFPSFLIEWTHEWCKLFVCLKVEHNFLQRAMFMKQLLHCGHISTEKKLHLSQSSVLFLLAPFPGLM